MFGLFRKSLSLEEFGHAIVSYVGSFHVNDAGRSVGMLLENPDGSAGWISFIERRGIPQIRQATYYRLFTHAAIQACVATFEEREGHSILHGSIHSFPKQPPGYDFEQTYKDVDRILATRVDNTSDHNDFRMPFLANPQSAIVLSDYLYKTWVADALAQIGIRSSADRLRGPLCSTLVTTQQAIDQIRGEFRIAA